MHACMHACMYVMFSVSIYKQYIYISRMFFTTHFVKHTTNTWWREEMSPLAYCGYFLRGNHYEALLQYGHIFYDVILIICFVPLFTGESLPSNCLLVA